MPSVVLVIDVQVGLVSGAYLETQVLANINRTVSRIRAQRGQIIFIQHCHATFDGLKKGNPGWALHSALDARVDDGYVEKTASDAFYQTDLHEQLAAMGATDVFVTGLQTEYCVDATCRAAQSQGYQVHLVQDAHTTGDSHLPAQTIVDHHNAVLANLAHPHAPIQLVSSVDV